MIEELDWYRYAACKDTAFPELWFPTTGESQEPAKRVCKGCESRSACLDYAMQFPRLEGIWGATNPVERERIRKQRQRDARRRRQNA